MKPGLVGTNLRARSQPVIVSRLEIKKSADIPPYLKVFNKFDILDEISKGEISENEDEVYEDEVVKSDGDLCESVEIAEELVRVFETCELKLESEVVNILLEFLDKSLNHQKYGTTGFKIKKNHDEEKSEDDRLLLAIQTIVETHQRREGRTYQGGKKVSKRGEGGNEGRVEEESRRDEERGANDEESNQSDEGWRIQ